jgi:cobaltochelatase CobN
VHLLAATAVAPDDAEAAVDLGQTPGDLVVLSAADSDLSCLAVARARLGAGFPSLRLASLLKLAHPLSVDLYVERVVARARLVVVRLLGGRSYWGYGIDRLVETCRTEQVLLAVLPGDDRPDPELRRCSTVADDAYAPLARYLAEGGIDNARHFLAFAAGLIGHAAPWAEPAPVPKAGLYFPDSRTVSLAELAKAPPRALVLFYRALVQAGDLAPVDALIQALDEKGLPAVGLFVSGLKDPVATRLVEQCVATLAPAIVLGLTGFAVGEGQDPLRAANCPVLQVVLGSGDEAGWRASARGLGPRDLAMQVALTELDGRILSRAISFKAAGDLDPLCQIALARHRPVADRVDFVAALAAAWVRLRDTPPAERRIAIVLANYPIRDGRLANGVGLDTPASCAGLLQDLAAAGYRVEKAPATGDALIRELLLGVTNDLAARPGRLVRARLPLADYRASFKRLPEAARERIEARWGPPEADPHLSKDAFPLAVLPLGNVVVALQPSRGWDVDPEASWHSPDLPPPHAYLALYLWLRECFGAQALVHLGKHGNLEWLPGKALALSKECFPELALGPLPLVYPFIVNDPGEGTQAKRRSSAVIVDHLTPPLTRAGSWGELSSLERLLDEHWQAQGLDPRRLPALEAEILDLARRQGLDRDLDLDREPGTRAALARLDTHLCELKELQVRDGLHILGRSPEAEPRTDLLVALARLPRGDGRGPNASLHQALARDLGLDLDPLAAEPAEPWHGPRPEVLSAVAAEPWRSTGDTIERLELLARALVAGERPPEPDWPRTAEVLREIFERLAPALDASGAQETAAVLAALDGRRVAPGPSGAPSRGRPEVLPTGRNFFSVDTRAVPTPAAWRLGWAAAAELVERYAQLHGDWPRRVALTAWGTANMRTGGDDIAQALALLGCRPVWEPTSGRVVGVEVLPLSVLDRPRVDVTLRISGLFRDAFPAQIELLDDAVRAVAALDEPPEENPLARSVALESERLVAGGFPLRLARRRAGARIFSAMPGAYGTGLQARIDGDAWADEAELSKVFTAWGEWSYGRGTDGEAAEGAFARRLAAVELVVHAQDNREHDLLDSDDYWQFEGGLALAVRQASGRQPEILHLDTSRPERPRVARLQEEIGKIVRGRATNPRWLAGVMRHGYKGAAEIAATVDYLFAFAATSGVVGDHHFDALFDAYLADETVKGFIAEHNPAALREIGARLDEAIRRGLWRPRRNSVAPTLEGLRRTGDGQAPAAPPASDPGRNRPGDM